MLNLEVKSESKIPEIHSTYAELKLPILNISDSAYLEDF